MIELNGFRLEFSTTTFTAHQQCLPDSDKLRELKEQLGDAWFLYWDDGVVLGLPRVDGAPSFGEQVELSTDQHLKLLAARIADVLPHRFPEYKAFRRRPFSFLGRKDELVSQVKPQLSSPPPLLERFKIRPKFELDARLMELQDGDAFIGLFMQVHMRWEILASLDALAGAGLDLGGLYVVRREPGPDQRRAVGRVAQVGNGMVYLSESFDETTCIPVEEVWLEGSKASFARCLKVLLGPQYPRFDEARQKEEGGFCISPQNGAF